MQHPMHAAPYNVKPKKNYVSHNTDSFYYTTFQMRYVCGCIETIPELLHVFTVTWMLVLQVLAY